MYLIDGSESYNEYDLIRNNMFILCDNIKSTYGYVSMSNLCKYPESYIKLLCDFELKYNLNRSIILNCNASAIEAIIHFYENGNWNPLYTQGMIIYDVIPKECETMKYSSEYIFHFLQLPSCYPEKEVKRYYKSFATKEAIKNKKKNKRNKNKKSSHELLVEKFTNEYYLDIPDDYLDYVNQDNVDHYVRERLADYYGDDCDEEIMDCVNEDHIL